jgi:hypothetical protein
MWDGRTLPVTTWLRPSSKSGGLVGWVGGGGIIPWFPGNGSDDDLQIAWQFSWEISTRKFYQQRLSFHLLGGQNTGEKYSWTTWRKASLLESEAMPSLQYSANIYLQRRFWKPFRETLKMQGIFFIQKIRNLYRFNLKFNGLLFGYQVYNTSCLENLTIWTHILWAKIGCSSTCVI